MKLIYPRRDTAVSSTTANANFPDDNVLDYHPKKVWKATTTSGTLTLTVSSDSNAVALFGMNVTDVTITVKNMAEDTTLDGPDAYDLDTLTRYYTQSGDYWTCLWADYSIQAVQHKVLVAVSGAASIAQVGVAFCGKSYEFPTPGYGISQRLIDYSVIHELNYPGALYIKQKDVARGFSGALNTTRDNDFWYFMRDFVIENGPYPVPWKLTDQTNRDWVVFASLVPGSYPGGNHGNPDHSLIDFSIIERF